MPDSQRSSLCAVLAGDLRLLLDYCLGDVLDNDEESAHQLKDLKLLSLGDETVGTMRLDASISPAGMPLPYFPTSVRCSLYESNPQKNTPRRYPVNPSAGNRCNMCGTTERKGCFLNITFSSTQVEDAYSLASRKLTTLCA